MVASAAEIKTEVYLSLLIDRGNSTASFIGCKEGGVEIEETAKTDPDAIKKLAVSAADLKNLAPAVCKDFAAKLFSDAKHIDQCCEVMVKLAKLFAEKDADLIEINPLIIDGNDDVVCLDAKVTFDDNALFRHDDVVALRDMDFEDEDELTSKDAGLSFIRLDGEIGCMVNGAGLAMATLDIIKHFGGSPANFLDVGGSSNPNKVVEAFKVILKDKKVKVIFINIFGGITRAMTSPMAC
jgi:succinyl-CoA synthetase beta subunit